MHAYWGAFDYLVLQMLADNTRVCAFTHAFRIGAWTSQMCMHAWVYVCIEA